MKSLLLILMFTTGTHCFGRMPAMEEVRRLYQKAATEKESCKKLVDLLNQYGKANEPLINGYKAVSIMMKAKYAINPFTKFSYFCKGRNLLEKAIAADRDNVELRFLRLGVQTNVPRFLGYHNNVAADKSYISKSIHKINDKALSTLIVTYLQKIGV